MNTSCAIECSNCVVEKTVWTLRILIKILKDTHLVHELRQIKKEGVS